ncbi:hypothetical protein C8J57DRAFT_1235119 [Mycena rebaudengoi]|nr:hypothetical protein C8J57DRAFT_1235119 [Mycena rebaudengoi]
MQWIWGPLFLPPTARVKEAARPLSSLSFQFIPAQASAKNSLSPQYQYQTFICLVPPPPPLKAVLIAAIVGWRIVSHWSALLCDHESYFFWSAILSAIFYALSSCPPFFGSLKSTFSFIIRITSPSPPNLLPMSLCSAKAAPASWLSSSAFFFYTLALSSKDQSGLEVCAYFSGKSTSSPTMPQIMMQLSIRTRAYYRLPHQIYYHLRLCSSMHPVSGCRRLSGIVQLRYLVFPEQLGAESTLIVRPSILPAPRGRSNRDGLIGNPADQRQCQGSFSDPPSSIIDHPPPRLNPASSSLPDGASGPGSWDKVYHRQPVFECMGAATHVHPPQEISTPLISTINYTRMSCDSLAIAALVLRPAPAYMSESQTPFATI